MLLPVFDKPVPCTGQIISDNRRNYIISAEKIKAGSSQNSVLVSQKQNHP